MLNDPSHQRLPHVSRYTELRLPAAQLDLREIDTVLFVIERVSLPEALPNMLAASAFIRAVTLASGTQPTLRLFTENQLSNAFVGSAQECLMGAIKPGQHAILLTAASLYTRQMAQLAGMFAIAGATLYGAPHVVADSVPLGNRHDPHTPIRPLIQELVRDETDPHVRELLRLAEACETGEKDPILTACSAALYTLQASRFTFFSRRRMPPTLELIPTLEAMTLGWSKGEMIPHIAQSLIAQHQESSSIAEVMWRNAKEVAPGVYETVQFPIDESDEVIRACFKDRYEKDPRATYVLEQCSDRPATKLRYEEALQFERRLGAGESPEELLRGVKEILTKRKDEATLSDIAFSESREREPHEILERIFNDSQYIPDPSGKRYVVLKSPDESLLYERLQQADFPLITVGTFWLCNLSTGQSRPATLSFQAQHLERFLEVVL